MGLMLLLCCTATVPMAFGQTQPPVDSTQTVRPRGTLYAPPAPSKFHLGLALSPNLSFGMSRDYAHWNSGLVGQFGFEFVFDMMFTDSYAVSTGVHVFNTGGRIQRFQTTDGGTQGELDVVEQIELRQQLQYVELPVTFKMRTRELGYTTFVGEFGAGFGINVRAEADEKRWITHTRDAVGEEDWVLTGAAPPEESRRVILDDREPGEYAELIKSFRPSMIIGLGIERRFTGTTALLVGLTYNMGLNNIYQANELGSIIRSTDDRLPQFSDGEPLLTEFNGKSAALSVSVGVMF